MPATVGETPNTLCEEVEVAGPDGRRDAERSYGSEVNCALSIRTSETSAVSPSHSTMGETINRALFCISLSIFLSLFRVLRQIERCCGHTRFEPLFRIIAAVGKEGLSVSVNFGGMFFLCVIRMVAVSILI